MKKSKLLAILLVLALAFSILTSCDIIMGSTGDDVTDKGDTDNVPDDNTGDKEDENNKDPEECEHLFENSTCVKCGEVCTIHVWFNGFCTICNYNCNHKESGYKNSVCQNCGRTCVHIGSIDLVDTCMECGTALENLILVQHLASNNSDYVVARDCTLAEYIEKCLGTTYAETTKNGYRWFAIHRTNYFTELTPSTVLFDFDASTQIIQLYNLDTDPAECEHFWALNGGGYCCICKSECNHHFIEDGGCEYCRYFPNPVIPEECEHLWVNGVCSKCQEVCTHNWVSGTCGTCDTDCNHTWVGGICSTCGVDCTHSWGDSGICVKCGNECEHNFKDGYCTVCHKADEQHPDENCEHVWKDGICANCLITCPHEWKEGVCLVCEKICEHDFDPDNDYTCTVCGTQAIVPPECNHEWVDGVCTLCEKVCEHDFGLDVNCHICGELLPGYYILVTYKENEYKVRYEITLGEFISEYLGTTYEETVATGAYWMTVDWNYEKVTLEKDSYFMNCGMVLELYLIGGAVPPSPECEHEWVDDYCPKCGRTCDHSYSDSVCTICGKVCENHYFFGGECLYCGKPCEHVWSSYGYCEICNIPCDHPELATYGYCSVCGYECQHYWIIDHCDYCGYYCEHTFDGPTCTKCGYMSGGIDNPIIITFDGQEYYVPYSASFMDFYYMAGIDAMFGFNDYQDSLHYGYWVVVTNQGDVRIGEYTALCDIGNVITIAFRRNGEEECSHSHWTDGVCDFCGKACEDHHFSDGECVYCGKLCEHSWTLTDMGAYCEKCFTDCYHNFKDDVCKICGYEHIPEYVNVNVTFFYWTYPEYMNPEFWGESAMEMRVYCDKLYLRAGTDKYNTLANFISEYAMWNQSFADFEFTWYVNGMEISDDTLLRNDVQLVAVDKKACQDLSTNVIFSVENSALGQTYYFPHPVDPYYVSGLFEEQFGINTDIYSLYYSYANAYNFDGFVYGKLTGAYKMDTVTVSAYSINKADFTLINTTSYLANARVSITEYLQSIGLNADDYYVFDFYGMITDLSTIYYDTLYLLEKSKFDGEATINLSIKRDEWSETEYATITLTEPMTLDHLLNQEAFDKYGNSINLPSHFDMYAYVIDGETYCPYVFKEHFFYYFYEDCTVDIVICYPVSVEFIDYLTDEWVQETYIFLTQPTGQDVLDRLGRDMSYYTPYCDWTYYEYDIFVSSIFGYGPTGISFIPNKVHLTILFTDLWGNEMHDFREEDIKIDLAEILSQYENCKYVLKNPDGSTVELSADELLTIYFNPDYATRESDYGTFFTYYTLEIVDNSFIFELTVDGEYFETRTFSKSDGYTLSEILALYGVDYDSYEWFCMSDGGIQLTADYVPTGYIRVEGYDTRPSVSVYLDNKTYKLHHQTDLTLGEAIDLFNETYGQKLTFGEYLWYIPHPNIYNKMIAVESLDTIVAKAGEWTEISVVTFNMVKVYFESDMGPVTEGGINEMYPFLRDYEWFAPEVGSHMVDMTHGIVTFTGEYEYRVYDEYRNLIETIDINSTEELFALHKDSVVLYAKYVVNYEKICGTYIIGGEIIVITEDTITSYSSWNNYSGYGGKYNIILDFSYIHYRAEDGSFDYPADYFYEDTRIDEDDFYIVVFNPNGWTDAYDSYESYIGVLENYQVDYVTDANGNLLSGMGQSGLYFVYTKERTDYEWRDGYLYFGEYPQSLKADDVIITDFQNEKGYYLGSDGEWYIKHAATTYKDSKTMYFSNKELIVPGQEYYFKIEPIRWVVLENENNTYSLVCADVLMSGAFNSRVDTTDYLGSEVREWLTNEFYYEAFSSSQQSMLLDTYVGVTDNAGNNVYDYVYLLSKNQASAIEQTDRVRFATDFARANGLAYNNSTSDNESFGSSMWWLLTINGGYICTVGQGGNITRWMVYDPWYAYVPAITVTIY